MKNLFFIFSIAFSFAFADTNSCPQEPQVSCECLEQGTALPLGQTCFPPAYSAPATIQLRSCWDMSLYGSFIYWNVAQQGMEIAIQEPTVGSEGSLAKVETKYQPGFKIGLGVNLDYDDWTSFLEYTWMHQNNGNESTSKSGFVSNNWFFSESLNGNTVRSAWTMNLDQLDLAFSRPFYQGQRLTIAPFGGLRGLWIRQKFDVEIDANEDTLRSHCWSVGPMMGAVTNWLLDCGFRFEGKGGASVLFTNYGRIFQNQISSASGATYSVGENFPALRPMMNLGTGLGWATYVGCKDYSLDLSARYDFHVLWDQNVMLQFANNMNGVPGTSGDLYLHGLTLTMRLDF